ncbi:MAG: DUF853 domain-containing protein [Gammaproteobacteria bacterium]|nr:DUF853 domain-containing protein [Gammaproteobacteria bacterium]MDH5777516.1 DUF853 domain-containing protein [Gammaproteobacteria bacterium]
MTTNRIRIGGHGAEHIYVLGQMANRHGLVAGATGTGKTVTLQTLAEGFSCAGVPVFLSDIKGDLSGLAQAGQLNDRIEQRNAQLGINDYQNRANPVIFWDLYGKNGHALRTTISDMGPVLLSALMELNETQTGVLHAVFRIADDQGLLLLDLKDLKAMLNWVSENAKSLQADYGSLPTQSINTIMRALLVVEEQGGDQFFGEPAMQLNDLMQIDFSGNGVISILDATQLIHQPRLYSMFLLWLLSELFEQLPEVGDLDKPKLVFFFDEAHLLFNSAPKALLEKLEQVVRLIRSKGVGIYFVTQNPLDIPDNILGQLGHRIQHALRAFTPKDQKAVKVAAQTFRQNPNIDTEQVITTLGVGEALVSVLDEKGTPGHVQHTLIAAPESRIGPLQEAERQLHLQRSPLRGKYDQLLDRQSAYEMLKQQHQAAATAPTQKTTSSRRGREPDSITTTLLKSVTRSIGSQLGRQIVRGVLGSLLGGKR